MYVNPFIMGAFVTIFFELAAIMVYAALFTRKGGKK